MMDMCACGKSTFVPLMALRPVQRLDAEVAFFHNGMRCGWAFECRDCDGQSFVTGLATEADAIEALRHHLMNNCGPSVTVLRQAGER